MEEENEKQKMETVKLQFPAKGGKIQTFSFWFFFFFLAFFVSNLGEARAATLSIQPSSGTFQVGSTFDVSLYLDTQGQTVNAVEAFVRFDPDKLQIVSSIADLSIIDLWVDQPKYNNRDGTIELRGGIPKGVNTTDGLITKLRFRVKGIGTAVVKFTDESRVLLHDGKGTDALYETRNTVYQLVLPPPAGPFVVSPTHPDESKWYPADDAALSWANEETVEGYSYVLNEEPVDIPDDTSEGLTNGITYRDLSDGQHYFHLKAIRNGAWGGVTHFAIQVDTTPPAEFPPEVFPSEKTTEHRPTIVFQTTDNLAGVDHYELKIVSLRKSVDEEESQPFFFEAESPYVVSPLELGTYDIIVRSYDKAGNFRDVSKRFSIVNPLFQLVGEKGLEIRGIGTVSWVVLWIILGGNIFAALFIGWLFRKKYRLLDRQHAAKGLPFTIKSQLDELKEYQKKYGKLAILLIAGSLLLLGAGAKTALAQTPEFSPPIVSTLSRAIANDEIFYVGGVTELPNTEVVIFLQNKESGALTSQQIASNSRGEWFYRHNTFLVPGEYLLWTQSKRGEEVSAPSPQMQFSVRKTALDFGATKISYEVISLAVSILLLAMALGAGLYMFLHIRRVRRKHKEFQKEIREAEESIRRGFAVLKRDIQRQLALVRKAKLREELSKEQRQEEEQLLKDLAWAESYIGKEVWDVAETEHDE